MILCVRKAVRWMSGQIAHRTTNIETVGTRSLDLETSISHLNQGCPHPGAVSRQDLSGDAGISFRGERTSVWFVQIPSWQAKRAEHLLESRVNADPLRSTSCELSLGESKETRANLKGEERLLLPRMILLVDNHAQHEDARSSLEDHVISILPMGGSPAASIAALKHLLPSSLLFYSLLSAGLLPLSHGAESDTPTQGELPPSIPKALEPYGPFQEIKTVRMRPQSQ